MLTPHPSASAMPRLAPFTAPRDPRGSASETASRPSTPFVPAWLRGFAEREEALIVPAEPTPPASVWVGGTDAWTVPSAEHASADSIEAFLVGEEGHAAPVNDAADVQTIEAFLAAVEPPTAALDAYLFESPTVEPPTAALDAYLFERPKPDAPLADAIDEHGESDADLVEGQDASESSFTLDSTADEIASLARALAAGTRRPTPVELRAIADASRFGIDPTLTERTGPDPLPAWSDEDFVDIMPAPSPSRAPLSSALDLREEAARAFESIAGRVRRGDLELPVFVPGMGDAAMLAAALAALLAPAQR
jgi:hypothetical protein